MRSCSPSRRASGLALCPIGRAELVGSWSGDRFASVATLDLRAALAPVSATPEAMAIQASKPQPVTGPVHRAAVTDPDPADAVAAQPHRHSSCTEVLAVAFAHLSLLPRDPRAFESSGHRRP